MQSFRAALSEIMHQTGINQSELARAGGVSASQISRYLLGATKAKWETVARMLTALPLPEAERLAQAFIAESLPARFDGIAHFKLERDFGELESVRESIPRNDADEFLDLWAQMSVEERRAFLTLARLAVGDKTIASHLADTAKLLSRGR